MRTRTLAILATALLGSGSGIPGAVAARPVRLKPDTRQARPLDHWPTQADLDLLGSVMGRTPAETIRVLGHPSKIARRKDGRVVWSYPWLAACTVTFKQGVVVDTFYTAGY
jgi:hypothetical protein